MHIGKCCESSLGFAWPKEKFPSVGNMQISVSNIMSVLLLFQYSVKKDAINSFSRLSRQSSTMPVFDLVVTLVTDESMEKDLHGLKKSSLLLDIYTFPCQTLCEFCCSPITLSKRMLLAMIPYFKLYFFHTLLYFCS